MPIFMLEDSRRSKSDWDKNRGLFNYFIEKAKLNLMLYKGMNVNLAYIWKPMEDINLVVNLESK